MLVLHSGCVGSIPANGAVIFIRAHCGVGLMSSFSIPLKWNLNQGRFRDSSRYDDIITKGSTFIHMSFFSSDGSVINFYLAFN